MKPVILLVEDEEDLLQVLSDAFGLMLPAYECVSRGSLEEADEVLADLEATGTPLALVVVDHLLGGRQTGLDLIERVHAQDRTVPTLLFTGQAPAAVEARAAEVGAQVLWKPVRLKTLLDQVNGLLAARC